MADVLHEALRALGVPAWRRNLQVVAVLVAVDRWGEMRRRHPQGP